MTHVFDDNSDVGGITRSATCLCLIAQHRKIANPCEGKNGHYVRIDFAPG
jgi:hypothetical protein